MRIRDIAGLCVALLLATGAHGQAPAADRALREQIRALRSTLRVLQITAHPGEEDGALLLSQARGLGAEVTLLTLTRGERGENSKAILEPSEQGLRRTMEQLASDRQYGVEQRFARMVDFGFARTADEVFDRWGGPNAALGDMVRVIRETHPDVIVIPYDSSSADGDGQHAATTRLAREAFRAAADAKKFPEQLNDGVEPWQAKRLFALAGSGGYTVAFNAGETGAGDGESWQQRADRARTEQGSQAGMRQAAREPVRRYRLIDSAPGGAMGEGARDFAEGLDTGLEGLAGAAGLGAAATLEVRSRLQAMDAAAAAAGQGAGDRAACIAQLAEYLRHLRGVEDRSLGARTPAWLRAELAAKRRQAEQALVLAAEVHAEARLGGDSEGAAYVLVPGASFSVQVDVRGAGIRVVGMELKPEGGRWTPRREWNTGETHAVFRGRVPADAPFTRPQFLLENDADGTYRILDERNATRPLPPASLQAVVEVEVAGELVRLTAPVEARDAGGAVRTVMVAPPLSVIVEPRMQWNRRTGSAYGEIEVRVRSNLRNLQNAMLSVHPPSGWRAEPEHEILEIEGRGAEHSYRFFLVQERGGEGSFPVRAVVRWGGAVYDQGYAIVRGPADQFAFDYRPSMGSLASAAVDVPESLAVGYVGVEGDPIPAALGEIGVRVTRLGREELGGGQLAKYWAIVLGAHAVDERAEIGEARAALLGYVEQGGVVLMMAQSDGARLARDAPLPYALELGTARVTNAASAVEMVDEHDVVFWNPNQIDREEFRGWSEERGQCFAQRWDGRYEALLRMGDRGQPVEEGSLLRGRYGRGYVVYTGLSFSRQVAGGVPGALRLLVNLLSLGAELHR